MVFSLNRCRFHNVIGQAVQAGLFLEFKTYNLYYSTEHKSLTKHNIYKFTKKCFGIPSKVWPVLMFVYSHIFHSNIHQIICSNYSLYLQRILFLFVNYRMGAGDHAKSQRRQGIEGASIFCFP